MPDKNDEAQRMAETHYAVDEGITEIFRITLSPEAEQRPNEPIKLLEVSECTVPSGIMPLYFAASPERGRHFPLVVIEITPEEFESIQTRQLLLPDGWTIGALLPRPAETRG